MLSRDLRAPIVSLAAAVFAAIMITLSLHSEYSIFWKDPVLEMKEFNTGRLISRLSPNAPMCMFNDSEYAWIRPIFERLEKRFTKFKGLSQDRLKEYVALCKDDPGFCQAISIRDGVLYVHQMGTGFQTRHSDTIRLLDRIVKKFYPLPDVDMMVNTGDGGNDAKGLPLMMINDRIANPGGIPVPDWSFHDWATSQCPGEKSHRFVDFMKNTTKRYKEFLDDPQTFLKKKQNKMFWRGAELAGRGDVIKKIINSRPESIPESFYDVMTMAWIQNQANGNNAAVNCVSMNEHCSYRFLLHLRGLTSSNRLKYLLLCGSIVVMPKQEFDEWWFPAILPNNEMMVEVEGDVSEIHKHLTALYSEDENIVNDRLISMSRKNLEFATTVFSEKSVDCYWATVMNAGGNTWGTIFSSQGKTVEESLKEEFEPFSDL